MEVLLEAMPLAFPVMSVINVLRTLLRRSNGRRREIESRVKATELCDKSRDKVLEPESGLASCWPREKFKRVWSALVFPKHHPISRFSCQQPLQRLKNVPALTPWLQSYSQVATTVM